MLVLILTLEIGHYSIHWSSWAAVKLELAGQDPVSILGGFLSFLGEVPASGTGCIDSVISLLPRGGPYFALHHAMLWICTRICSGNIPRLLELCEL